MLQYAGHLQQVRSKGDFRSIPGAPLPFPKLLRVPEGASFRPQIEGARAAEATAVALATNGGQQRAKRQKGGILRSKK